ncbi:MAG: hypothetical protein ACRD16_10100 [Thermoanaerobaculia bacterium]
MKFFRACSWILPSAFLVALLAFLLTHGPDDPALAVYPFFRDWIGPEHLPRSAEVGFFLESTVLFLFPYAFWLAFLLLVGLAERAVFGRSAAGEAGPFRATFSRLYVALLLVGAGVLGASTGLLRRKLGGDTQVGAVAVAAAPFASSAAMVVPAFVLAIPVAGLLRMRE